MADYWLSFRISTAGNNHDRYDRMIKTVNDHGTGFWDGPTSFIAIRSGHSIDTIGKAIKAAIDDRVDLAVIREIGVDSTRYIGEPGEGFAAFFPKAKKL